MGFEVVKVRRAPSYKVGSCAIVTTMAHADLRNAREPAESAAENSMTALDCRKSLCAVVASFAHDEECSRLLDEIARRRGGRDGR